VSVLNQRFEDHLGHHHQGSDVPRSLMMMMMMMMMMMTTTTIKTVLKTLVQYRHLTQLITQKDFINFEKLPNAYMVQENKEVIY
jgi:hypothetical protein